MPAIADTLTAVETSPWARPAVDCRRYPHCSVEIVGFRLELVCECFLPKRNHDAGLVEPVFVQRKNFPAVRAKRGQAGLACGGSGHAPVRLIEDVLKRKREQIVFCGSVGLSAPLAKPSAAISHMVAASIARRAMIRQVASSSSLRWSWSTIFGTSCSLGNLWVGHL